MHIWASKVMQANDWFSIGCFKHNHTLYWDLVNHVNQISPITVAALWRLMIYLEGTRGRPSWSTRGTWWPQTKLTQLVPWSLFPSLLPVILSVCSFLLHLFSLVLQWGLGKTCTCTYIIYKWNNIFFVKNWHSGMKNKKKSLRLLSITLNKNENNIILFNCGWQSNLWMI